MSRIFTVNSRKFNGTIRRSWQCELVSRDEEGINLIGTFEDQVEHRDLGIIEAGTVSLERFYFNRWYNYFLFQKPDGVLRNYYINICMPPRVGSDTIDYVDLDIDLVVWPDGKWQTLDLEEFEANRSQLAYTEKIVTEALASLNNLKRVFQGISQNDIEFLHHLI